jgi:hypothetical protein
MAQRFTDEMTAGLQCLVCLFDYREDPSREAVPVATYNGGQMAACRGECAETYSGRPDGFVGLYGEELLPLEERVAEFDSW